MESNILAALDFRHKPSGRTEGPAAGRLAACGRGWQLAAQPPGLAPDSHMQGPAQRRV
jgi:hypothetical protein